MQLIMLLRVQASIMLWTPAGLAWSFAGNNTLLAYRGRIGRVVQVFFLQLVVAHGSDPIIDDCR